MTRSVKRGLVLATLLVIGASLAACATSEAPPQQFDSASISAMADRFRADGRDDLAAMFADGSVDASDYESAFKGFSTCMQERGYSISEPSISPADNIRFIFSVDGAGKDPAVMDTDQMECSADLREVEAMYAATATQRMDPPLQAAMVGCLDEKGLEPPSDAQNYQQFLEAAGGSKATTEWRVTFSGCLSEVGQQLYPNLPYLPVGY